MKKSFYWPIPVRRALRELGRDINIARRKRRVTLRLLAERAGVSRAVLGQIEKGQPSVSMGAWASVLFVLGWAESLEKLASAERDFVGHRLTEADLPQRVHTPRKNS